MPEVFYPASSLLLSGREVDSGSTHCRNDVISGSVLLQEWRLASFCKGSLINNFAKGLVACLLCALIAKDNESMNTIRIFAATATNCRRRFFLLIFV